MSKKSKAKNGYKVEVINDKKNQLHEDDLKIENFETLGKNKNT